jgi:nitrite reductase/ring-hydroxylating ferredoxin subunit
VLAQTPGGIPLFITKLDGDLYAMGNTCTHAGGPLNEGQFVGQDRCEIECPWHASRFSVKDGSVHGGPAVFDEPTWSVRAAASGKLEVRAKR